jgi:hypothetical protein
MSGEAMKTEAGCIWWGTAPPLNVRKGAGTGARPEVLGSAPERMSAVRIGGGKPFQPSRIANTSRGSVHVRVRLCGSEG